MPYLTLLLAIPLLASGAILLVPGTRAIRPLALGAAALTLGLSLWLLIPFNPAVAGPQLVDQLRWNPRMGTSFALGVDGFSLPMVILAALLTLAALLVSSSIQARGYYALLMILESAILGVFLAIDWALFYLFWEMTLIPLFFLVDRWGGRKRQDAAINFVLYTLGGSVFLLISLLMLFDASPERTFAMAALQATSSTLDQERQTLIFLGMLVGFGVKMPIFPLHGWLPLAHVEAPAPVSILLSGILLKMGAYGLIRAAMTLPAAVMALQTLLATLAFIGLFYGGLLAWRQRDMKRMIAYSSISHMGVVLLGIATLNVTGLTGAVYQMVAHGLAAGSLFLLLGLLYERTHTRQLDHYSAIIRITPRFAFFIVFAFIAAVGLPGSAGFIAELHTLVGGYERWGGVVILLAMGVVVSATYAIRTVGRLLTGPTRADMAHLEDLRPHESAAAAMLAAGILLLGIYPAPLLALVSASVHRFGVLFAVRF